jgi:nucleotidyltransferase/DNA polymerase involved in DNA repair
MILCVRIPYFAASIERLRRQEQAQQPLLLLAEKVIYACSPEAAQMGVTAGIRLSQAQARCPEAILVPAQPERYIQARQQIASALQRFTPRLETSQGGQHAYFFLAFKTLSQAKWLGTVQRVAQFIRLKVGLIPALGAANPRYVARLAACLADPGEILFLAPGGEKEFLAPLPISALPLDPEQQRWLALVGLRTVGQFAALPRAALVDQFGKRGAYLHRLAQGQDERPVRRYAPPPLLKTAHYLVDPVSHWPAVESLMGRVVGQLATALQQRALAGRHLSSAWHLEDGSVQEMTTTLIHPTAKEAALVQALKGSLAQITLTQGITGLEVTLSDLQGIEGKQLDLFAHGDQQRERLRQVIRDLDARYGHRFYRVELVAPEAHLLEHRFRAQEES